MAYRGKKRGKVFNESCLFLCCWGKVSRMPEIIFVPFYLFYAKYSIALSESCTDLFAIYLSVIWVEVCPIIPAN